jgi:DNA-binding NarL/FixJ family response regulator
MTGGHLLIVDDHPLFRSALRQVLEPDASIRELNDLEALKATLKEERDWDLVLLDLNLPGSSSLSGLLLLRAEYPELPVMIISGLEDPGVIQRAMELGASGYLVKSSTPAEIRAAVETVLAGRLYLPKGFGLSDYLDGASRSQRFASLTPQQVRVLAMMSEGLMNKQIAHALSIAEATVKAHVSSILQKLGVDSRTQAVMALQRLTRAEDQDQTALDRR